MPLSDRDLQDLVPFSYDEWMLRLIPDQLERIPAHELVVRNALIEAFGVHARALVEFFFPKERGRISAQNFVGGL